MNTATANDYSRFENMDPALVWETFNHDTPDQEYVRFIRTDTRTLLCVEADDSDLVLLAKEIADNCDVTATDRPHVIEGLTRCMRDELGDHCARTEMVAKAIREDAHRHLADVVEHLEHAIANADYASVSRHNAPHVIAGITESVSELWDLLHAV
jgi:hypothetical protein